MDIQTISLDEEAAQALYDEYRALGSRSNEEDQAILAGLREIKRGHSLIDLNRAIPAGGCDEAGRPRLAISRGDQQEVQVLRRGTWRRTGESQYYSSGAGDMTFLPSDRASWESVAASLRFDFAPHLLDEWVPMEGGGPWFAMVPTVPPHLRPRGNLSRYHILWEVKQWSAKSKFAPPPRDPALLRLITGSLYAVLAVWDLTDLERTILGMMRAPA